MNKLNFTDIELFVSVYKYIDSNMYIFISQNEALVVDPHTDDEMELLLAERKVHKVTMLLTHEHPDHISGIWWFLENFECTLICSKQCAARIANSRAVRPLFLTFILEENDTKNGTDILSEFKKNFVIRTYNADITYSDDFNYSWQGHHLYFKSIQGHSIGSSFIILDDKLVFTGDSLLKEYPIIVSFPNGSKQDYLEKTLPIFEKELKCNMILLPGHGEPFVLSDIMKGDKINVEFR